MASEIRVNKLNSQTGVGTITLSPTGVDISGITTAETLRATTGIVTTFETTTGNITTLRAPTGIVTSLTTNTLTANSTAKVGSGVTISPDGDVFATGVTTCLGTSVAGNVIVGAAVTITESGIEASGIGITCASINGAHIGGRRNMIINGAMYMNQRNDSSHTLNSGNTNAYVVDRFNVKAGEGTLVASQDSDVPTGQGFVKSIKLDCTGADTSLDTNFESYIQYLPEAQDLVHLAYGTSVAKTVTFSFWVKSNLTSGFGFYYYMPDTGRAYQTSFTVSSANTWEKKVITVVGDTSGSGFVNDNGIGAEIRIYVAGGTGKVGSSNQNAWGTDVNNRIPSGTNILSSTDNNFYFTGFQMEIGDQATPFEFLSVHETLLLCQRYYYRHAIGNGQDLGVGMMYTAGLCAFSVKFPVSMRAAPSLDYVSGTGYYNIYRSGASDPFAAMTIVRAHPNSAAIDTTTGTSGTEGVGTILSTSSSSSYLAFSAEF